MPVREPGITPLFQAEFGLFKFQSGDSIQNIIPAGSHGKQAKWGNLNAEYYDLRQQEGQFDLLLELSESDERISGYFKYSTDVFEHSTIKKMAARYKILLEKILLHSDTINSPLPMVSELSLITDEEKNFILEEWNDTKADYPSVSVLHDLFDKQSEITPDNTVVVFGDKKLSYSELKSESGNLANVLRNEFKIKRNELVCILMDKSEYMIITLLAVLKSGGAYVPIDPDYPQERINYILDNCKSKIIISNKEHKEKISKDFQGDVIDSDDIRIKLKSVPPAAIENINEPDDTAYVIYTSGTTGDPKGCLISHRNVVRLMKNDSMQFEFNDQDVWVMSHSYCFDFSVWEMYGALLYGGKLIVPLKDEVRVISDYLTLIKEHKVTVLNQTPLAFYNLISEEKNSGEKNLDSHLRYVIFGGDKLEAYKLKDWEEIYSLDKIRLVNMYGITETTVHVTYHEIKSADLHSEISGSIIGRPIPETTVYVFDKYLNLLPPGIMGEFYVGGSGVAKGYLFRDELTKERFIRNPLKPEERIYKTGDEGYLNNCGDLVYTGRIDNQVKIRGFRIEPGEIDNLLLKLESIKEAVVLSREERAGDKRLVAYVVFQNDPVSTNELRQYLKDRLPEYMVPTSFVILEELPVTSNGKIDKKALVEKELTRNELESKFVLPQSDKEKVLAKIWQEIIGIDKIGVHDNFFELGGDSIISIQIIAGASQEGIRITPKQIFRYQTIAELASVIGSEIKPEVTQDVVTGDLGLTPIQHWFFEQDLPNPDHFVHSVLLNVPKDLNTDHLKEAVKKVVIHHDALRLKFVRNVSAWIQTNEGVPDQVPFSIKDLTAIRQENIKTEMDKDISELQSSLSLSEGHMIKVRLYKTNSEENDILLIVIHHLCTDGLSWRIILEDLYSAYKQLSNGDRAILSAKTNSFKDWSDKLYSYSSSGKLHKEIKYWFTLSEEVFEPFKTDLSSDKNNNTVESAESIMLELDKTTTQKLLKEVPKAYNTQINDILLTALILSYHDLTDESRLLIDLEGHGREDIFEGIDLSRTVGWFTTIYPVMLKVFDKNKTGDTIKSVKENLRSVPENGIGFGILKYLSSDEDIRNNFKSLPEPEISFNYMGQFGTDNNEGTEWKAGKGLIKLSQDKAGLEKTSY